MMIMLAVSSCLILAKAQQDYQPCPILGPRFPRPSGLSSSKPFQASLQNLTQALNDNDNSASSSYTQTTPNTTSYSIALFDASTLQSETESCLYQYHHTAPALSGLEINGSSVYNIGGLSQVLTVYAMLIAAGDSFLLDPVTKYLPELNSSGGWELGNTKWEEIRIVDLATHLAGITRDADLDSISHNIPHGIQAILPAVQSPPVSNSQRQRFFQNLTAHPPIYQPATTPIYSNAAFQVLGFVLEQISGVSFASFFENAISKPLNLINTNVGTPSSAAGAVIPGDAEDAGWNFDVSETALLAANGMFSTATDLCLIGRSILSSSFLDPISTKRWLKPHSYTSNLVNGVGMPFEIYTPTLTSDATGAVIPIFTKLGSHNLYSPYLGLVPDYGVGFVILSADTEQAADLNAYVDILAEHLLPALEKTAILQAANNYLGNYTDQSSGMTLRIDVDGLSGLSVVDWTTELQNRTIDLRAAYADLNQIPPATLDFRLYPTNTQPHFACEMDNNVTSVDFRAVFQDIAAPVDAGTPTCVTWEGGVDRWGYNGIGLDQFHFALHVQDGAAVALNVPAFNVTLRKE